MNTYRPQPGTDSRASNAQMAARILEMPTQPYKEDSFVYRVVEMKGRKSGNVIQVPIAVTMADGRLYLISPTIQRQWIFNLVADDQCTLVSGTSRERCRAERVNGGEAVRVLRVYISQLQWASQNFPFAADEIDSEILDKLDRVAVFRLQQQDAPNVQKRDDAASSSSTSER